MSRKSTRTTAVAILLVLLHLAPAAWADDAGAMLAEGLVRLRLGKFRQALKVLKRAARKSSDPTTRAQIHLNMGVIYVVLRKKQKARRQFVRALKLDPSVTLKKGEVKERGIALLAEVRSSITGTLEVTADQAGARVLVGDREAGKVPYSGKLPVGRYRVQVQSPDGLFRYEAQVVVRADDVHRVQGKLQFVGSKLAVNSTPPGARVLLDGKVLGKTPLSGARVKAGAHQVKVMARGFAPGLAKINAEKGGTVALSLTLKPLGKASGPAPATRPLTRLPSPPVEKPRGKRRFPLWTVVTGAAALAVAGAGIGLGLATRSAYEEYEQTTRQSEYWDLRDRVTTLQTGANVSFIAAGALALGAGAIYLFWERNRVQAERPTSAGESPQKGPVSWRVLPAPNGLVVQF